MRNLILVLLLGIFMAGCETMPPQSGAASDFYQRGRSDFDAGLYPAAIKNFKEATRLDPRFGEAFYWLGRSHEAIYETQRALDAYLSAVGAQPSLGKAHARAGIIYFQRHQYGPAESHLRRAIDYAAEDALAYYYLGEIYRMQGKCKDSVDMYKAALVRDPGLLDAREGLRRAEREICGRARTRTRKVQPKYEKADDFTGGGKALKPGEW